MLALGLVETRGLLAAIEGADAMLKAADICLLERNLATGGLVTITVAGEVSAVQASVDAAKACILRIGGAELVSAHVIARPDEELASILRLEKRREEPEPPHSPVVPVPSTPSAPAVTEASEAFSGDAPSAASPAEQAVAEARLKRMSLNRLRQMAWNMEGLSMSEEAVASADKKSLIAAIVKASGK